MTENDVIELSRYQASKQATVEHAIRSVDSAMSELVMASLTSDGARTLREQRGHLLEIQVSLTELLGATQPRAR